MESRSTVYAAAPFQLVDGTLQFRNLPLEFHRFELAGHAFEIAGLKDAAALLDDPEFAHRFIEQDMAPYGMELWPAAYLMADHILRDEPGKGRDALDLGCGLGLVAIAASRAGWRITASDYDEMSLCFARYNVERNDAAIDAYERIDWRCPPAHRKYDRIFGADVLYQLVDHVPIAKCVDALLTDEGTAVFADANRAVADRFPATAAGHGFRVEITPARVVLPNDHSVRGRLIALRRHH